MAGGIILSLNVGAELVKTALALVTPIITLSLGWFVGSRITAAWDQTKKRRAALHSAEAAGGSVDPTAARSAFQAITSNRFESGREKIGRRFVDDATAPRAG